MNSNNNNNHVNGRASKKKSNKKQESNEVDELLQSAQDEISLKSYMCSVSPHHLPPDLHRRFQALTSKSPSPVTMPISQQKLPLSPPQHHDDDDLFARFAALKVKAASSNNTSTGAVPSVAPNGFDEGDGDEEDEVEKIILWAKDAARLDPSPPSDDDISTNDGHGGDFAAPK